MRSKTEDLSAILDLATHAGSLDAAAEYILTLAAGSLHYDGAGEGVEAVLQRALDLWSGKLEPQEADVIGLQDWLRTRGKL
jgi:hypothetical protein